MKNRAQKLLSVAILAGLALPAGAMAAEADLQKRIDDLEAKVKKIESKSLGKWLTVGGDYRFRYDYLQGEVPNYQAFTGGPPTAMEGHKVRNTDLYTNRFGLDLKAKVVQDVTFTARMLMYKAAGGQDDAAANGTYFADRAGLFDGTLGHVPGSSNLLVDRVYATWNNIAEQPIWFSIGRRPSTAGIPSHLKQNVERPGNSGVPQLLVDYAFDGVTVGYAPDIEMLPGFYTKFCYGRGFQHGYETSNTNNNMNNTDMIGLNVVPYDTDPLRVQLQYNRGMNIFNSPDMLSGPFGGSPTVNLGDIDWLGFDLLGKAGDFNWFVATGMSMAHPNDATALPGMPVGLMYSGTKESHTGHAVYLGGRYDIESTRTKLGLEYNYGSKYWMPFSPAADDMWTSKVGTRGNVYEGYLIQELALEPISSHLSKTFFKVGYQYYDFKYTGSNNWVGGPIKIADVNDPMTGGQMLTPLKTAQNLYVTFEVKF